MIEVEFQWDEEGFLHLMEEAKDSALDAMVDSVKEQILNEFETGTGWDGAPWAPLAPSTVQEKKRKGYPLDILIRTGAMRDSLQVERGEDSITVSMDSPAGFHNDGGRYLPKRLIISDRVFSDSWAVRLERSFFLNFLKGA